MCIIQNNLKFDFQEALSQGKVGISMKNVLLIPLLFSWCLWLFACDADKENSSAPHPTCPQRPFSAALEAFDSCDDLETRLKANLSEEMKAMLLQTAEWWGGGGILYEDGVAPEQVDGSTNSDKQEGEDYSGTNNQESGVDEADFVKTDGDHIYLLNGNRLEIFGTEVFGDLVPESTLVLEGRPNQMLIAGDRAVVFSYVYMRELSEDHPLRKLFGPDCNDYDCYRYWYSFMKTTVLDISDRTKPLVLKEMYMEGWFNGARKVDGSVWVVTHTYKEIPGLKYWPDLPEDFWKLSEEAKQAVLDQAVLDAIAHNEKIIHAASLDAFLPSLYMADGAGGLEVQPFTEENCKNFSIAQDSLNRGITSVMTLQLLAPEFSFASDHIVSGYSSTVYASKDTLVLAEASFGYWWYWYWWMNNPEDDMEESTNIHRFDISQPKKTTYTGSERIRGYLINQFALSEYKKEIRAATTTGLWWRWWRNDEPDPIENHVYVLQGEQSPKIIGHLGGIAMDETIWSVRFVQDKAYVVTFERTDPLWTIDLKNGHEPKLIAGLEVPGVSTYIHPMAEDRLLTIGYGGDQDGLDWTPQVSMFDVGDFANPSLLDTYSLTPPAGDDWYTWSWSEALYQHKAFQYWGPKKLLAVPLNTYRYIEDNDALWGYRYEYFTNLELITVDAVEGFARYGSVSHAQFYNQDSDCYYWRNDIRRSIFMGDFIYAISDRGITVHNLEDLSLVGSQGLPGNYNPYCYDDVE